MESRVEYISEDHITGEVINWVEWYKVAKTQSDKYQKDYNLLKVAELIQNYSIFKIYLYLREEAEYSTNRIDISTDMKKDISVRLNISYSNISTYLKKLYSIGILLKLPSGSKKTFIHPFYSWVGKESIRMKVLEYLSKHGIDKSFTELLDRISLEEKQSMMIKKGYNVQGIRPIVD